MRGVYKTAQGRMLNMDNLRLQHENERAVGNMGVNARGDQIDNRGNVVRGRNEVVRERYNQIDKIRKSRG